MESIRRIQNSDKKVLSNEWIMTVDNKQKTIKKSINQDIQDQYLDQDIKFGVGNTSIINIIKEVKVLSTIYDIKTDQTLSDRGTNNSSQPDFMSTSKTIHNLDQQGRNHTANTVYRQTPDIMTGDQTKFIEIEFEKFKIQQKDELKELPKQFKEIAESNLMAILKQKMKKQIIENTKTNAVKKMKEMTLLICSLDIDHSKIKLDVQMFTDQFQNYQQNKKKQKNKTFIETVLQSLQDMKQEILITDNQLTELKYNRSSIIKIVDKALKKPNKFTFSYIAGVLQNMNELCLTGRQIQTKLKHIQDNVKTQEMRLYRQDRGKSMIMGFNKIFKTMVQKKEQEAAPIPNISNKIKQSHDIAENRQIQIQINKSASVQDSSSEQSTERIVKEPSEKSKEVTDLENQDSEEPEILQQSSSSEVSSSLESWTNDDLHEGKIKFEQQQKLTGICSVRNCLKKCEVYWFEGAYYISSPDCIKCRDIHQELNMTPTEFCSTHIVPIINQTRQKYKGCCEIKLRNHYGVMTIFPYFARLIVPFIIAFVGFLGLIIIIKILQSLDEHEEKEKAAKILADQIAERIKKYKGK